MTSCGLLTGGVPCTLAPWHADSTHEEDAGTALARVPQSQNFQNYSGFEGVYC